MIKEKLRLLIGREQPPSQNALSQYDFRHSVYGMDAFYPGVHSLNDWISCVASYFRELREGKVSEVIIHRRNFPSDSAGSR